MQRIILFLAVACLLLAHQAALTHYRQAPLPAPPASPAQARAWLEGERAELLAAQANGNALAISARSRAYAKAARVLAAAAGEQSPRGFVIYSPAVTLQLLLYDRAADMCKAASSGAAIPAADELLRLGGEALSAASHDRYPSAARVRDTLTKLPIPSSAMRGYRVYLLPFSLGPISGLGGPGFALLAADPPDERLIPNQLEVTLVHEFGHHLHLSGMPWNTAAGRSRWDAYLRLRGLSWREDGRVNTAAWAGSPEENFAEDFRLLFGRTPANEAPPATNGGDPREERALSAGLRALMRGVASRVTPSTHPAPWPEEADVAPLGAAVKQPLSWFFAAAGSLALVLLWLRKDVKKAILPQRRQGAEKIGG